MKVEKNPTTIALKTLLKTYSRFFIHGHRVLNAPSYSDRFVFELTGTFSSHDSERTIVELEGDVHGGHTDKLESYQYENHTHYKPSEAFRPTQGFWSLYAGEQRLRDAVESIPDDAKVSLEVYLDFSSNEVTNQACLHTDVLFLRANWKRGKRDIERKFIVDVSTCRHNSARFGGSSSL